jgi:BolA protein
MNRIAMMTERLAVLHPIKLEIVDESHKHAGHAGARAGGGHYLLQIISADFAEKNKTSRQRMVYSALAGMMERDIHALTIDAKTPGEIE